MVGALVETNIGHAFAPACTICSSTVTIQPIHNVISVLDRLHLQPDVQLLSLLSTNITSVFSRLVLSPSFLIISIHSPSSTGESCLFHVPCFTSVLSSPLKSNSRRRPSHGPPQYCPHHRGRTHVVSLLMVHLSIVLTIEDELTS